MVIGGGGGGEGQGWRGDGDGGGSGDGGGDTGLGGLLEVYEVATSSSSMRKGKKNKHTNKRKHV